MTLLTGFDTSLHFKVHHVIHTGEGYGKVNAASGQEFPLCKRTFRVWKRLFRILLIGAPRATRRANSAF